MRIRVLGQNVPASIAVLALIEAGLAFFALYAAVLIRYQTPVRGLRELEREIAPIWPRAMVFSAIVVVCLLAFGLYSGRQRAQFTGLVVRLAAALVVSSAAIAAVFYAFPVLQLWRGIAAIAVVLTGCAVLASRIVFGRAVDQQIFKRRVLVYGAGASAAAIANLRRVRLMTPRGEGCGYVRSVIRNVPLIIPVWNLVEVGFILAGRPRTGDRIARTTVTEE